MRSQNIAFDMFFDPFKANLLDFNYFDPLGGLSTVLNLLVNSFLATEMAADNAAYTLSLPLVFIVGFIAAVTLGSIAWYNSKRPVGWEDKKRPDVVPKVEKEENPGLGNPNT